MLKKSIIISVVLVASLTLGAMASAATVNDILQSLRDAGVPEVYVLQAESYMAGKTVSATTADAIINHINNASGIADGEKKLSKLTGDQKSGIMTEISAACALLNMTASYSDKALTVKDATGNTVLYLSSEDAIKQTGYDYSLILLGLAIMIVAGVSAVVLSRKSASQK